MFPADTATHIYSIISEIKGDFCLGESSTICLENNFDLSGQLSFKNAPFPLAVFGGHMSMEHSNGRLPIFYI